MRAGLAAMGMLVVAAGCGSSAPSQVLTCPSCVTEPSDGQLLFTARVDFGSVYLGAVQSRTVSLENRSGSSVRVSAPLVLRGSFGVDLGNANQEVDLAPGAAMPVRVIFQPFEAGAADVVVTLGTDAGGIDLHLTGTGVKTPIACDPPVLDFGVVHPPAKKVMTFSCKNEGPAADHLRIDPVTDAFTLEDRGHPLPDAVDLAAGDTLAIDVDLTSASIGSYRDVSIPVVFEDAIGIPARVTTHAILVPTALSVDIGDCPTPISMWGAQFGFVPPGGSKTCSVKVRNRTTDPVLLTGLAMAPSSDPEFTLSAPAVPLTLAAVNATAPGVVEVKVTFAPTDGDVGARAGQLVATANGSDPTSFDVVGFAGGPAIFCSASSLDFGAVAPGETATLPLSCSNAAPWDDPTTNADDLQVSEPYLRANDGSFRVTPLTERSYPRGEKFDIAVSFTPFAAGPALGALVLDTNDPLHPELVFQLHGTGAR